MVLSCVPVFRSVAGYLPSFLLHRAASHGNLAGISLKRLLWDTFGVPKATFCAVRLCGVLDRNRFEINGFWVQALETSAELLAET